MDEQTLEIVNGQQEQLDGIETDNRSEVGYRAPYFFGQVEEGLVNSFFEGTTSGKILDHAIEAQVKLSGFREAYVDLGLGSVFPGWTSVDVEKFNSGGVIRWGQYKVRQTPKTDGVSLITSTNTFEENRALFSLVMHRNRHDGSYSKPDKTISVGGLSPFETRWDTIEALINRRKTNGQRPNALFHEAQHNYNIPILPVQSNPHKDMALEVNSDMIYTALGFEYYPTSLLRNKNPEQISEFMSPVLYQQFIDTMGNYHDQTALMISNEEAKLLNNYWVEKTWQMRALGMNEVEIGKRVARWCDLNQVKWDSEAGIVAPVEKWLGETREKQGLDKMQLLEITIFTKEDYERRALQMSESIRNRLIGHLSQQDFNEVRSIPLSLNELVTGRSFTAVQYAPGTLFYISEGQRGDQFSVCRRKYMPDGSILDEPINIKNTDKETLDKWKELWKGNKEVYKEERQEMLRKRWATN